MGRQSLLGMLEQAKFEQVLMWHLQGNHFPPVTYAFDMCKWAIERAKSDDLTSTKRDKSFMRRAASVTEILDAYHLWDFINKEEE